MVMKFNPDQRAFAPDMNNVALQLNYAVETGCAVTEKSGGADMSVDVAAGTILFNGTGAIAVAGGNYAIAAAHPSLDRYDLVLVNVAGTVSVLTGTPASVPKTPSYDAETYICLARVFVDDGATSIVNADIFDQRIINTGGGGGTGTGTVITGVDQSGCTDGDVVTFDGSDFVPAQANSVDTSRAVGIIDNVSGSTGDVTLFGEVDFLSGLTPGETYYLSDTVAGGLETTPPAIAVKIGEAISATTLLLDIDRVVGSTTGSKYTDSFTSQTSVVVTHNLNDSNPIVQVYDNNSEQITPDTIDITDANTVTVTFLVATTGTVVVHSIPNATRTYTGFSAMYSESFTGQTSVAVNHNLGQKYVAVQVFDNTDQLVEPTSVTLTDANNLTVTFGVATSGEIVVVGGAVVSIGSVLGVKRYSTTFTSQTTVVVTHSLNTVSPSVMIYDGSGDAIVGDIAVLNANQVQLDFGVATSGTVEVQGGAQTSTPGAGSGDFLPDTDNAYDLGSGTYKWKDIYVSGSLNLANVTVTGSVFLGVVASDPGTPTEGQIWYNSTDKQFKGYNGTSTVILG